LISIAYRRAQHYYRIPFSTRDTWVIGDTHHDILAGRRIGVNTLAVATGAHSQFELARFQPTALLQDLDDWQRFIQIITGKLKLNSTNLIKDTSKELADSPRGSN